jgi:hypothetical protein
MNKISCQSLPEVMGGGKNLAPLRKLKKLYSHKIFLEQTFVSAIGRILKSFLSHRR